MKFFFMLIPLLITAVPAGSAEYKVDPDSPEAIAIEKETGAVCDNWFTRDRFGMFIHWGISAVPKSVWAEMGVDPSKTPGDPSWYFNRCKIPTPKWKTLASRFDPSRFDAEEIVLLAKQAGMKYLVFTSKHHDGFAMFDSAVSDFDIMDASPFKRDITKEFSEACRKHGLKFCLYYSQAQDWEHPDGANNTWDYDPANKDFARYFETKCKPQIRELMENYGPIGLFWFDTPVSISSEQSKDLYDMVKSVQSDCLVNSRIGHGYGDYMTMGDSQFPDLPVNGMWETASTTHDVWFYLEGDKPRFSPAEAVRRLIGNVSRGGNVVLNFGPDPTGRLQQPAVELLRGIGKWMESNSESIYGCGRSPFYSQFDWGTITTRPGFVYLHIFNWPGRKLVLNGLENKIQNAYLLATGEQVSFKESIDSATGLRTVVFDLPETAPDSAAAVIKLKITGEAGAKQCIVSQMNGITRLDASMIGGLTGRGGFNVSSTTSGCARVNVSSVEPHLKITDSNAGYTENWTNSEESISWDICFAESGKYDVYVVTSAAWIPKDGKRVWVYDDGHEVAFDIEGNTLEGIIKGERNKPVPFQILNTAIDRTTKLGSITLDKPCRTTATLKLQKAGGERNLGLNLRTIVLVKQ